MPQLAHALGQDQFRQSIVLWRRFARAALGRVIWPVAFRNLRLAPRTAYRVPAAVTRCESCCQLPELLLRLWRPRPSAAELVSTSTPMGFSAVEISQRSVAIPTGSRILRATRSRRAGQV